MYADLGTRTRLVPNHMVIALGPPDHADRGDRAQVLDQHPVDGESDLA